MNDHFLEYFVAELPSESACFSTFVSATTPATLTTSPSDRFITSNDEKSPSQDESSSNAGGGSRKDPDQERSCNTIGKGWSSSPGNTGQRQSRTVLCRMATEYHSVGITIGWNDRTMGVGAARLPLGDTIAGSVSNGGGRKPKHVQMEESRDTERTCIVHSYLSMEPNPSGIGTTATHFFLEAFAIKVKTNEETPQTYMEQMDGTQHSNAISVAMNATNPNAIDKPSSDANIDLVSLNSTSNIHNQQPKSNSNLHTTNNENKAMDNENGSDIKIDDPAASSEHKDTDRKDSCFLILRGTWPDHDRNEGGHGTAATVTTEGAEGIRNVTDDTSDVITPKNEKYNEKKSIRVKKKSIRVKKKKKRKNAKDGSNPDLYNATATIPLSKVPLLVKLCSIGLRYKEGSTKGEDDKIEGEGRQKAAVGLFVASPDDRNLRFFTVAPGADADATFEQGVSTKKRKNLTVAEVVLKVPPKTQKSSATAQANEFSSSFLHRLPEDDDNDVGKDDPPSEEQNDGLVSEGNNDHPLDDNPLYFSSPVMAIETLSIHQTLPSDVLDTPVGRNTAIPINYVAIACQNGEVRIISYLASTSNDVDNNHDVRHHSQFYEKETNVETTPLSFVVLHVATLIVDGPVVSLSLTQIYRPDDEPSFARSRVSLVVGSLCGFCCTFHQSDDTTHLEFDGPFMLTEGLWCGQIDSEDGVLAVREFQYGGVKGGRAVAIGTYSGRLLMVAAPSPGERADEDEEGRFVRRADPIWYCQLPHPVHGIVVSEYGLGGMLVITRKTVHLFEAGLNKFTEAAVLRLENLSATLGVKL